MEEVFQFVEENYEGENMRQEEGLQILDDFMISGKIVEKYRELVTLCDNLERYTRMYESLDRDDFPQVVEHRFATASAIMEIVIPDLRRRYEDGHNIEG